MFNLKLDRRSNKFLSTRLQAAIVCGLVVQLSVGFAASPAIGVAVAHGAFDLDASKVSGNGTLFDGSTVETGKATSELKLNNGARMVLDSGTRTKVYSNYLLLEKGTSQLETGSDYRIKARSLQVTAGAVGAARVSVMGPNRILVASLGGGYVRVTNSSGMMLAAVSPGRALEFETPQEAGASAPSTLSGCLVNVNGHFLLTDATAGVTAELQGSGIEKEVGNKVEVTGVLDPSATPVAGATQVIRTSQVKMISKGCSAGKGAVAAGAAGAAGAGAAGAGAGTATAAAVGMAVATKVIIAGVVIAGAGAFTAVGLTAEDKPSMSK